MTETEADNSAPNAVARIHDPILQQFVETGALPANYYASTAVMAAVRSIAEIYARSSMVPADYRGKPDNCAVALMAGLRLNLDPLACLTSFAVINGRPTLWGDGVVARMLAHPSLRSYSDEETGTVAGGDYKVSVTLVRAMPNGTEQSITRSFGIEDAKRAKLWGKQGPWSQYPERMCLYRARTFAIRDLFADALAGISMSADDEESVREVVAVVKDAPPTTTVDEADGLAPTSEPKKAPAKKAAKKSSAKGKVKDEQKAAEAAAALNEANAKATAEAPPEVKDKTLVSAKGATVLRNWCRTFDELEEGGCHYDPIDGTVSLCNGERWREVNPEEGGLYANICDHLSEHMARYLTKWCLSQRMDQEDAMNWAKEMLGLKKAPAKFLALTTQQLAELVHETE